ncbi:MULTISPECIES: glutamate-1-semialdehyde 2,1-aminomutase [Capnocytophaga]|uniref:Glutamate-1-semialdehyde 2,1-aminomutase n=1 Tax=Capnocytophaga canis TaxID=1848903 RepID=A0A0B7I162_9FLAO|nr:MULTISPECIES: glutamate-1-semialdehyde 2,1-aminomutase [Capnocytophaga]ATA75753.1 aspartate aminotransferase family protein [Capnocytophaga sp. H2931]RIY36668.1 glutamate-1-semialdehyde-2,1-aminomutase [Capnocytophaga canis]GIM60268.1 glutamate-1-semialdehyde 2,1-aminomutase [Capnocytophaga canis]CEN43867.1 glutamate-1-semialdehyde aminotransferase (aminomutase) [Capnocytophaga canis]
MIYKRSSELFAQAKKVLPGGVNSPVRAFNAVGGEPIFIKEGKGAYLYDEDGRKLIDYIASWGPLILGHAYPPVVEAVVEKAKKGTSFGIPTEIEIQIAELAVSMVPNIDKIRFVNSGTEACMSAIRLARGYTKREKIIKFSGCYHGHSDSFLIQAGSGATTFGSPNSPGVTQGTAKDTLLARYNDIESVKSLFETNKDEIAGVIIEPVAGNMGCVPPKAGFMEALRKLCTENGALLIFDEVMTGFRLAKGGAQEVLDIQADIVTFGKVIGGGLPVGAFASRNEIMNHLAPEGLVYQAGTLSGNPLAMSAGLAMLTALNDNPQVFKSLEEKTAYLHRGFEEVMSKSDIPFQINRFGSMISLHFNENPVVDFESSAKGNIDRFKKYFHGMLAEGIYLPPSAFESYFLNDALSYEDLDVTIEALNKLVINKKLD